MSDAAGSTRRRAQRLMERVLRDGEPLDGEYPLIFRAGFPGEVLALEEGGAVRSACALLVRDLLAGPERLRVGLIGSVSTDPAWRGRGFASRLLARAEARLTGEGCLLALLWADDPAFYERRGWSAAGCERLFVLDEAERARLPRAAAVTIRAAAPDDFGAVHRLYGLHRSRADRTLEETRALLSGPGVDTLVLERGRDIAAYACLGRGRDLSRCVHEWAGVPDDVLALCAAHVERQTRRGEPGPVILMTPPRAPALHARLEALGVHGERGILGLAKLLDPAGAAEVVRRASRWTLRAGVASAREGTLTSQTAVLRGPAGERELGSRELLGLLLAPRDERAPIEALERELGVTLPGLPLSAYVWGLDSI